MKRLAFIFYFLPVFALSASHEYCTDMFGLPTTGQLTDFEEIFAHLYEHYGPQGWWPVTREGSETPQYIKSNYERRSREEQLEIIIGAILTQNTSWKNAEIALMNLNTKNLMNLDVLAAISETNLGEIIRASGYYNQKAKKIQTIVAFLKKESLAKLEKLTIPELRTKLLTVKGIGNETADSIILYAFNGLAFVIDSYTKRIFARIGLSNESIAYTDLQKQFETNIPENVALYNEYHALIVSLAKEHCKKEPSCSLCPIKHSCKTGECIVIIK